MRAQAPKKDTQSAWFDIAVFTAVAAFFLFSAKSLLRSQSRTVPTAASKTAAEAPRALSSRRPAQIASPVETGNPSLEVLRLDCLFGTNNASALTTKARLVQIVAPLCSRKPMGKGTTFHGKNSSSGEDIVPFVKEGKEMSTSFFALQEGSNRILFELIHDKELPLRRELELVREPQENY